VQPPQPQLTQLERPPIKTQPQTQQPPATPTCKAPDGKTRRRGEQEDMQGTPTKNREKRENYTSSNRSRRKTNNQTTIQTDEMHESWRKCKTAERPGKMQREMQIKTQGTNGKTGKPEANGARKVTQRRRTKTSLASNGDSETKNRNK